MNDKCWDAMETTVLGMPVAWTVDDEVYVHTGGTSQRADGYAFIGTLEWESDYQTTAEEDAINRERLRDFVCTWVKANQPKQTD